MTRVPDQLTLRQTLGDKVHTLQGNDPRMALVPPTMYESTADFCCNSWSKNLDPQPLPTTKLGSIVPEEWEMTNWQNEEKCRESGGGKDVIFLTSRSGRYHNLPYLVLTIGIVNRFTVYHLPSTVYHPCRHHNPLNNMGNWQNTSFPLNNIENLQKSEKLHDSHWII